MKLGYESKIKKLYKNGTYYSTEQRILNHGLLIFILL